MGKKTRLWCLTFEINMTLVCNQYYIQPAKNCIGKIESINGSLHDLQDIYDPQSLDYFFDVSNRHKCRNPMTTLKFLFAHAHTKLAFLDPWYRTSLSHFYSETQLLQPRLTWIFQQLLILAPLCLHSFRQRKKRKELKNVALFLKPILLIWQNLKWQKMCSCANVFCHFLWKKLCHLNSHLQCLPLRFCQK